MQGKWAVGDTRYVRRRISEFIRANLNLSEVIGLSLTSSD